MEDQILTIRNLNAYFGDFHAVKNVNMTVYKNTITAIMGPSGCGKTTLIRCINRLHELTEGAYTTGEIYLKNNNILSMNPIIIRRQIGMVFQKPNPFPTMSIYDNVIAGYKINGIKMDKTEMDTIVENALKKAALWDEVKDKLKQKGAFLSGGQQQRLCIARAIAMKPEIILLDEPTSALDPKSTLKIEELLEELKKDITILIVTHNIAQAARISDYTAFMYLGELIEYDKSDKMFTNPSNPKTNEYLKGCFG
ncbi:MAG: phosphate ABC transporter ATP-binding protein PstB [Deltaproteobacteria bacterium]|nr:phosphate ABC transporter ATP-binding protein PstB [Deltaproteobacteria bacterium]